MREVSLGNFGFLVAYLVPGSVALFGLQRFVPDSQAWLHASASDAPTVGGFLYVTLASLVIGLTVSTVRWMVIDRVLHLTGVRQEALAFAKLQQNLEAFVYLVEGHYRYYQFYANMAVSMAILYAAWRWTSRTGLSWIDLGFVAGEFVFLSGSRDTLTKFYRRASELLG